MTATIDTSAVKVGSIFKESWGYDQTNVDFYQVTRISASGKTVWIRHIGQKLIDGAGGPHESVVPDVDNFHEAYTTSRSGEQKRLLKQYNCGNGIETYVNMTSYSSAYLWNGKPAYQTGALYGH